jgi:predicted DNA-binding protein with PD1-like motif
MKMTVLVPPSGQICGHAFRLRPDDSLKECLCQIAEIVFARIPEDECSSLLVMTAVGSLKDVTLRLANATRNDGDKKGNEIKRWQEKFEIVSLVGTFSRDGSCHLHLSISDAEGNTFGGHLMDGVVFTTCEVVLGSIQGVNFPREFDDRTGFEELIPRQILRNESWFKLKLADTMKAVFYIFVGYTLHSISRPAVIRK